MALVGNCPFFLASDEYATGHKEKRARRAFEGFDSLPDSVVTGQVSLDFSIFLHDTSVYRGKYLM